MELNQIDTALSLGENRIDYYMKSGHKSRPYKVLSRVFEYAQKQKSTGVEDGIIIFSWQDLYSDGSEAEWIKDNLKKAAEVWQQHSEDLNQKAFDEGLTYYPLIELNQRGGGSGRITTYRIVFVEVRSGEVVDKNELPAGYIGYSLESVDTKNPLIKAIDKVSLKGFTRFAFMAVMILALSFGAFILWLGFMLLIRQDSFADALAVVFIASVCIGVLFLFFSPLYSVVTQRIIIAPSFLTPWKNYSTQIEFVPSGDMHNDGKPIREFRIVTYTAECALCGGRVDVESGGIRHSGRLIGVCTNSPREHRYSFDHQIKIGKLLHKEYIELPAQR